MYVGVPKEIKNQEFRVGLTPAGAKELVMAGHNVLVQSNCGEAIGFSDEIYLSAGAEVVGSAAELFERSELIVKVKEPQPDECRMLKSGQTLFTYLHLAPDPEQTELLVESGATCIAYETVTDQFGQLPLLAPMSEVAGRLSIQAGAHHLEKAQGGAGVLLGGVAGVAPAKVTIIGGGVVGTQAATLAIGLGADVTILDKSMKRLRELDSLFGGRVKTIYSTLDSLESAVFESDLVIGAVLIPGAQAPKLVTASMVKNMKPGSVLVDVAIDQGGCFETSRPTTHTEPTFIVDGVIHYCVANMPGAVARTSTLALTNATLPNISELANRGIKRALLDNLHLRAGLNVFQGNIVSQTVANALAYPYVSPMSLLTDHAIRKAS